MNPHMTDRSLVEVSVVSCPALVPFVASRVIAAGFGPTTTGPRQRRRHEVAMKARWNTRRADPAGAETPRPIAAFIMKVAARNIG